MCMGGGVGGGGRGGRGGRFPHPQRSHNPRRSNQSVAVGDPVVVSFSRWGPLMGSQCYLSVLRNGNRTYRYF